MASVPLFNTGTTSESEQQTPSAAEEPKTMMGALSSQAEQKKRDDEFWGRDTAQPLGGGAKAKLDALNEISDRYADALRRIGSGENIEGIDLDFAKNMRKRFFGGEEGGKWNSKIPIEDLAVFLGVRNGQVQPTDETLPYIIQSLVTVASNGNVRGDFAGKRFMQFQSRTDNGRHVLKEGFKSNVDTAAAEREWEPRAVFDALQHHFDAMEESMADRMAMFNRKILAKNVGLNEGENYLELDHNRQFEIANNMSSIFDRDWLTTRVDNWIRSVAGEGYVNMSLVPESDVAFDRLMSGDGFGKSAKDYVDGFKSAVQSGEYYQSPSEFGRYLYNNKVSHSQYVPSSSTIGAMGTYNTWSDSELTDGDESFRGVRNDDGTYSLEIRRGGRIDREVVFKNQVMSAYEDMDGRYAAAEAVAALNENPEAWTIVNRVLDNQGVAVIGNGMDGKGLYEDLLALYEKEDSDEWRAHAKDVANAALQALGAVDTRTGFYSEFGKANPVSWVAGGGNALLGVGKTVTEWFRDDDYGDIGQDFIERQKAKANVFGGNYDFTTLGGVLSPIAGTPEVKPDHPPYLAFADVAAKEASKHTPDRAAEAQAYAESMRTSVYNLTQKRIFDDNTIIGAGFQFWADIYSLGKVFELGGAMLGAGIELTGRGTLAAASLAKAGPAVSRIRRIGVMEQRFGRAMQGIKNMRMVNDVKDFNKGVKAVRSDKSIDVMAKELKVKEMHDAFLQKVAVKYGSNPTEINAFVDGLAKFIGKIPTVATMYNDEVDRAYAEMLANTTVLDDKEFSDEERSQMMAFARGKGAVTAVMMAGLTHYLPKGFKKIMGNAKGELGLEADALDKLFLKICKGQAGTNTLTPENEFLFRACLSSAMNRSSLEAARNASFMFTLNEANTVIENNRLAWEKKRADPTYEPTVYDYLRGTGDALWEAGKAAITAGAPMAVIGGVGGARKAGQRKEAIRNTRFGLAKNELRGEDGKRMTDEQAVNVVSNTLLALSEARRNGNSGDVENIFGEIRRTGGARASAFMRQLEHAVRRRAGSANVKLDVMLDLMKGQDFSAEGLRKSLDTIGFRGAKIEDGGEGRFVISVDPSDYGDVKGKAVKFVVSNSSVPVHDGNGNWSKSFVNTVLKQIERGEASNRIKRIWDGMTPAQKRKAEGYTDENGKVHAPHNIKGIWEEALKDVEVKGVFMGKEAAQKYGSFKGEDVNLYDGLIVLSKGLERFERNLGRYNDALKSLDNIRNLAAKARGEGGATAETFLHEFFHAVTETLPIDSETRKSLDAVYGKGARGGDWREGFVDSFLDTMFGPDGSATARRVLDAHSKEERSLWDAIQGAASRLVRGIFGRETTPAEREQADSMREFIAEAVGKAPEEARMMREGEELERDINENIREVLGDEALFSTRERDRVRDLRIDSFDANEAIDAAIEIEREVTSGRRRYEIVGNGTVAGRRATEVSNLPDGRNLLVGAHVVANRFGTLEVSDPTYTDERDRSREINSEIQQYAKRQKCWSSDIQGWIDRIGAKEVGSGSEATVWLSKNQRHVIKAITPETLYDGDMRLLLERIAIHNFVSPDAPLRVMGFGMFKGGMNVIASQPYFKEGEAPHLTQVGFKTAMKDAGFTLVKGAHITDFANANEEVWISKDKKIVVGDLAPRNVAVSGNTLRIIDMAAYRNTPWLRDRADIPETLRPRGQKTYQQIDADYKARKRSAIVEFYMNMGRSEKEAQRMADGLYQAIGANGLNNLCGSSVAGEIIRDVNEHFFNFYNETYKRDAFDSEAQRSGSDEVRNKKVTFAELNKDAGVFPVSVKTKNGVTLNMYAMFGGTGYISAESWNSKDDIYTLGGYASGDAGIRFVWAGDAARAPKGYFESLKNPATAKPVMLGSFFFSEKSGKFVSKEAEAVFDAYPKSADMLYGKQIEYPDLAATPVFVRGSKAYADYLKEHRGEVSEPYFGREIDDGASRSNQYSAKKNMVLVDSLGSIVVHPDADSRQLAAGINEAVVRNIQLRERWEKPATRSALQFFKNIETPEQDAARQTQLFRLGSGRLRSLILDIVTERFQKMQGTSSAEDKADAWHTGDLDAVKQRVVDAIFEAVSNSYEHFSSEIEANALSGSFINRKKLKEARERGREENVPVDMQLINESMLDSIGMMREWQDAGLVDAKGSRVPMVERSRKVIEFYKKVVADAVRKAIGGEKTSQYHKTWVADEFSTEADKLFREYVRNRRKLIERSDEAEFRDANTTMYDENGNAVRTVETDLDAIDADIGGVRRDAMVNFVMDILEGEGLAGLAKLNDGKSDIFTRFDQMAREGFGDKADEIDIKNSKLSAATEALGIWKSQRKSANEEGVYSIEGERRLRKENRRLQAMVDRANAMKLRRRAIHNAHGLTRNELDRRIGMDTIGSLKRMGENGQKALADLIEENALSYIRSRNEDLAALKPEDFMKDPTVAAEFGATVASWISNAALRLSFGKVRDAAMRDVARIRQYVERPPLELIRGILLKNITAISEQMKRYAVDDVIERMEKVIDKNAMGKQGVVVDKELFKRKVEPRIQQYWKMVKQAFHMEQADVDARLDEIRQKYGDFAEALADIRDGKGSEGLVPTEETLLERDLAQLEYVALMRYGALESKDIGEVSDAVDVVAADIRLAQMRVENMVGAKLEKFTADRDALFEGCKEFRKGEKDGKYELSKFKSAMRSALYFNSPDLFKRLKMYFKTDGEAFKVCEELRRDMSMAHIDMERTIADYELALRDEIPAIYKSKYGDISFEKLMGILHEKVDGFEEFSRSGWRIPSEGVEYIDFDTGRVYDRDIAKYTVDVKDEAGKTIHKKGDTVMRTVKLNEDGRLLDADGNEIAKVAHRKGEAVIEQLPRAVGPDDSRHSGEGHATRLSLADLIYIYAARRQGDMRKNNAIYGCDDAYMDRLEAAIGPEGVAVADWMVSRFEAMRRDLTAVSERITGMPVMSPDILYMPLRFEGDASVSGSTKYKIDAFPSFLTRRVNHDRSVLREDSGVFDVFSKRVGESAHYMAFSDVIERVKNVFCDKKVENAYRELLGDSAFKQMYRQLFETVSGGVREPTGWFGRLRNFTTATTLFLNVPSAIKQFEGIAAYSSVMGVGHWLGNLHHMGRAYGILSSSNALKNREFRRALEDIGDPFSTRKLEGYSDIISALKEARDRAEKGGDTLASNPLTRFYMRNGLSLTTAIDSLASASMGCAFYNQKFAQHMKSGMTADEARRAAIADLDYAVQETQQSSRREFLIGPQADTLWGRVFSQFAGPAYIRFGMELEALHRAVYIDKNPKAWKNLVNKVIALHVVCPTALSLLGLGTQSICHRADDEDWARKAVRDWCVAMCLGPLSGWFIGGAVAQNALQTVANGFTDDDVQVSQIRNGAPMMSKIIELTTRTSGIAKDVLDGLRNGDIDTDAIAEEVGKIVDSLFPVELTVKRAVQNLNAD